MAILHNNRDYTRRVDILIQIRILSHPDIDNRKYADLHRDDGRGDVRSRDHHSFVQRPGWQSYLCWKSSLDVSAGSYLLDHDVHTWRSDACIRERYRSFFHRHAFGG